MYLWRPTKVKIQVLSKSAWVRDYVFEMRKEANLADWRPDSLNRVNHPEFDMQFMSPVIDSSFAELCSVCFTGYAIGIDLRERTDEKKQYLVYVMNLANYFVGMLVTTASCWRKSRK